MTRRDPARQAMTHQAPARTGTATSGPAIGFDDGAYTLDTAGVRHLVDAATNADPRYTPSTTRRQARRLDTQARYARWQRA